MTNAECRMQENDEIRMTNDEASDLHWKVDRLLLKTMLK
jgi:hypothetical protein